MTMPCNCDAFVHAQAEVVPGQEGLLDQDALINQEALAALKQLLEMQPRLLGVLLTSPRHQQGPLSA